MAMASSPAKTKTSTPRLSDRAKVVYPTGIVSTGWPEVERQHRRMGIRFDWFQVAITKLVLAKREDGTYASTVGGVVLSIPRQVGKTFMLCGLLFALCMIFPGFKALWTAQQLRTAKDTLRAMQGFARRKAVKPFVAYVRVANGEGEVGFINGSRILFGARDYGFGLGMAGVDALVFDEGQRLGETALDDMLPTQNRANNPLFFIVGTPPRPTDNGEVFSRKRAEALAGGADDMLYVEFSADNEKAPRDRIDWGQVARANPSYPDHTPKTAILRMWKNLGPDSFWREGYGIWDSDAAHVAFPLDRWKDQRTDSPPTDGTVAYGVKFSIDGKRVALSAALLPDGGPVYVECLGVADIAEGTAWLVEKFAAQGRSGPAIVVDGKSGAGDFVNSLRAARIPARRILVPTVDDVITAHSGMLSALHAGEVEHSGQPGLDAQVRGAGKRKIGNYGGWGLEPLAEGGDVVAVESVILARHGLTSMKQKSNRSRTRGEAVFA
jgi:hypothetical protein